MHTGTIERVSTDRQVFLVSFGRGRNRRWNAFMLSAGCHVELQTGDLVQGQLDSMLTEPLKRLQDGQVFEAFGLLVSDSCEAAQKLLD